MRELVLPDWATLRAPGIVDVEAEKFYPEILSELGVEQVDAYWLEIAKGVMKLDVSVAIAGTEAAPTEGGALRILAHDASKAEGGVSKWAQAAAPQGLGVDQATKDTKDHYRRIRGFYPS